MRVATLVMGGSILLGMGPSELIVILILALVIFGPKRLPEIAKSIGKAIGEFKKASQGIQSAVQKDLVEPITTIGDTVKFEDKEEGSKADGPH